MKKQEILVIPNDMPRYFGIDGNLDYKDIIAYVRSRKKDPREAVVIDGAVQASLASALQSNNIFIVGTNEDQANLVLNITGTVYFVFNVDKDADESQFDLGIKRKVSEFMAQCEVTRVRVLVIGEDESRLRKLWEFISSDFDGTEYHLPSAIRIAVKLKTDGIDISAISAPLASKWNRDDLGEDEIRKALAHIDSLIVSGKRTIQYLQASITDVDNWLITAATIKHDLVPTYISAYVKFLLDKRVMYPIEKMSLYERVNAMRAFPPVFGMANENGTLFAQAQKSTVSYPTICKVFSWETGEEVDMFKREDGEGYMSLEHLNLVDYGVLFKDKLEPEVQYGQLGLVGSSSNSVYFVEARLLEAFLHMSEGIVEDEMMVTVRNSVLAQGPDGKMYVLYCPNVGAMVVILRSNYIATPIVLDESQFYQFLDFKLASAMMSRETAETNEVATQKSTALMSSKPSYLRPAVPVDTQVIAAIANTWNLKMPYFEKRLRCDRNIVPIVVDETSPLHYKPFFIQSEIKLRDIVRESLVPPLAVTPVGCIYGNNKNLRLTQKVWKELK